MKAAGIIGAGLAGCSLAYELSKLGFLVTLFDKNSRCATEASGNPHAVSFPSITQGDHPLGELSYRGLSLMKKMLDDLCVASLYHGPLIRRATHLKESERLRLGVNREPWKLLASVEQSIGLSEIHLHESWVVSLPLLCQKMIESSRAKVFFDVHISQIQPYKNQWQIIDSFQNTWAFDYVIITAGNFMTQFSQLQKIPWRSSRGQIHSVVLDSGPSNILCAQGFIAPITSDNKATHVVGATYTNDFHDLVVRDSDSDDIIENLKNHLNISLKKSDIRDHFVQRRPNVPGLLPVAGEVEKNLFVMGAFASKGLTVGPVIARLLAGKMTESLSPTELTLFTALDPMRFQ